MSVSDPKSNLLVFYGTECPHCERMMVLVKKLEQEKGVEVEELEVWHHEENTRIMEGYDQDNCGGVPYFYNTKTKKWLCGEVSYQELEEWAK